VLDGTAGLLTVSPSAETLQTAQVEIGRQRRRREQLAQSRAAGAVTRDGHRIRLLVNASTEREVLAGLEAHAEGVGLLRTELAFLEAAGWPSASAHAAAVDRLLAHLAGRIATVRTLDFGADKTPPFLQGRPERGVALQLAEPGALGEQLRGLLLAAARVQGQDQRRAQGPARDGQAPVQLRIMLPLVESVAQLTIARELLAAAHADLAASPAPAPHSQLSPSFPLPRLGAMIETRAAVQQIESIAAAADFLSIGTNDLTGDILGVDRLTPVATVRAAADPRVLRAIRAVTMAAGQHGRPVEVCGEAAGDPRLAILLLGLGVSELSVAPNRLDEVRTAIQTVTRSDAVVLAERALTQASADDALAPLDGELYGL
jgi:phosphoenolpyruvate-protein kinase (PTS system EI component)